MLRYCVYAYFLIYFWMLQLQPNLSSFTAVRDLQKAMDCSMRVISLFMCVYIYIYICICVYIYIYIRIGEFVVIVSLPVSCYFVVID